MESREYAAMRRAENDHWWYRGLRMILSSFLDLSNLRKREMALDIGCGTGGTLRNVELAGYAVGLDASAMALGYCRGDGLRLLAKGSANLLPFRSGTFDVVTSLDVLCHRSVRPAQVAAEVCRVLNEDGVFCLNLPVLGVLQAHHDKHVGTVHRFTHGEVTRLMACAGLRTERITYWNTVLFPIELAYRLVDKCLLPERNRSEVTLGLPLLDKLFLAIMRLEAWLLRRLRLPIGLSVFAVSRRKR
ncbi:MAG: class I SAM-dependent methyltransferase [Planctomycetes bacterium]|nr:class I SAM-dependent methyltransferase [Planctomycetota bacterium]